MTDFNGPPKRDKGEAVTPASTPDILKSAQDKVKRIDSKFNSIALDIDRLLGGEAGTLDHDTEEALNTMLRDVVNLKTPVNKIKAPSSAEADLLAIKARMVAIYAELNRIILRLDALLKSDLKDVLGTKKDILQRIRTNILDAEIIIES